MCTRAQGERADGITLFVHTTRLGAPPHAYSEVMCMYTRMCVHTPAYDCSYSYGYSYSHI